MIDNEDNVVPEHPDCRGTDMSIQPFCIEWDGRKTLGKFVPPPYHLLLIAKLIGAADKPPSRNVRLPLQGYRVARTGSPVQAECCDQYNGKNDNADRRQDLTLKLTTKTRWITRRLKHIGYLSRRWTLLLSFSFQNLNAN
ncbi:hypothetical protein GGQ88_000059 [Novosphingobium hassiacum]|uniref:Uncharacterized protein n=1 Tax=Novosphingobium hassiacum TaxID=173676 RepID=A0A7W5ZTA1_9SPHN|nr:hypothetical protein [Novosphingobium hassiacum]